MKRQVRLNVFETNSSTQHALVIKSKNRHRKIADGIPEGFRVPEKITLRALTWEQMDNLALNTITNRILYLYNAVLYEAGFSGPMTLINFLARLQQLGIDYELSEIDQDYFYSDFSDDITNSILSDEETFLAFLFLDDIFYDTFADDCGSYEEHMKWEDTVDEFIKNADDPIVLRDRC